MSDTKDSKSPAKPFPELKNDTLLKAALGQPTAHVPIWLHRQAGRYLPEYLETSKKAGSFFTMCRTPELAMTVTLQPIARFPLDAAIIFSDILVVPQALGLTVEMVPGEGPVLPNPLVDPSHLARLTPEKDVDVTKLLGYVFDAITLTRHNLGGKVPLIGFAGAPWTLMAYMVEGGGAKSYNKAKAWLYRHPKEAHQLLQRITDVTIKYLSGQIEAGAQMLEVFDSWAGDLSPDAFRTFSLPYLTQIAKELKKSYPHIPITVFPKGAHYALEWIADETLYDVISLDWTMDPKQCRQRLAGHRRISLQGNLEPSALFAEEADLRQLARQMVDGFGTQGYICNLGHGMLPYHSPNSVAVLVDEIHKYSQQLNEKNSQQSHGASVAAAVEKKSETKQAK